MKWEFTIAEFSNSLSTESLEAKDIIKTIKRTGFVAEEIVQ